mmetsp:Transcript_1349/g.3817  ORF Transcript_1349/g.3817 Transcript_1349/m.3817 type:complete len:483 (+) Transcript_1349:151-1599(+)
MMIVRYKTESTSVITPPGTALGSTTRPHNQEIHAPPCGARPAVQTQGRTLVRRDGRRPVLRAAGYASRAHAPEDARDLDLGEDLLRHRDGVLNVGVGVGERHEAGLVLRGGEVNTALEHAPVPPRELVGVRLGRISEALDRALAEEETEHTADVAAADGVASLLARGEDAVDEFVRHLVQLLVRARLLEDVHRLNARAHRERVARESASLVHRARRRDLLHDLLLAGVRTDGEAATDDLAEGGEVRLDAPVLLRATVRDAESGHHLVEHEDGAIGVAELAQAGEELLVRNDEARVADDALEDHARDLALVCLEERLHRLEVVVRRNERRLRRALGHTGRVRQAERSDAGARGNEEGVGVAVVAAVELDHLLALGVRAHQAEHTHAGLGAGVGEAHHLHRRHRVDDHLRELVLERTGSAERRALVHGLLDRIQHAIVRVAHDRRAPRADVVDVLVAVDVIRLAALHAVKDNRLAADRLEGTHG